MFQENSIETCMLSRVKQITSPGWMHETSARTWCSGKTWRDWVEREVGGGIGMGKTCKPKAISFQCMTKFTTNKKNKIKKKNDWTQTWYGTILLYPPVQRSHGATQILEEWKQILPPKERCVKNLWPFLIHYMWAA